MDYQAGQGILGRIRFVDGEMPQYDRTYLIVRVESKFVDVLNISSVRGKEHKLAFRTNHLIQKYNPPFQKPSFAKLDSLMRVEKSQLGSFHLLSSGQSLDMDELLKIQQQLEGAQYSH